MVHSGSASQMKTSPTESPHRTAPPLQVAPPLVPPPGDTSDLGLTQSPAKHLSTDLTSVSPQPSTPADAHPVGTPAKALTGSSSPASSWSSTQTTAAAQGPVNGRTSGRKRTPKACDCCGPNSTGHNVKTSGRGKGRGRGALKDTWDTPKRKVVAHLTQMKRLDSTTGKVEDAKDEADTYEKVQTTLIMADTPPLPPVPVTSPQDAPLRNCSAPETACTQTNEDTSKKGSGVSGEGEKGCGVNRDMEMRLSGMPARRVLVRGRGRGMMTGAMFASKMKVEVRIKSRGGGCVVTGSQVASDLSMVAHSLEESKDALMEDGVQTHPSTFKSPLCNGDTVNLTDSESEEETKDDNGIMSEVGNGLLSFSRQSGPASGSDAPHDLDPDMDQSQDGTDQGSLLVTLSNGSITTSTDINHRATPMEVEPPQCPITVDSVQHHLALSDHRLYCHPGTWEMELMDEVSGKDPSKEAETSDEDVLERLTDMVHDFLESFYLKYGSFIPLSETDVLEHLKKNSNSEFSKCGLDIKRVMTQYRSGLASSPVPGFMVMYNKHSLGLEDLGTLEDQNWLNDQIINMYGELIMEATQQKVHFFNSFFHKQLVAKGYDGVKRWTKKVDLFSKWLLLIPIHLEIHWSLVTVTMATKTISYYDSQGIVFRHTTDNIMKYLQSEAREKEQTAFQKGWKITIIKGIPQQRNDSDCGVFVLEYCRRLSVKQPLLFSQEDMPLIRKRIYKEMCDCRLND